MAQSTGSPLLTNTSMLVEYGPVLCEPVGRMVSKGVFLGDNPMKYTLPLLTSQIGLVTLLSTILRLLLRPLSQPEYIADILGGIALGPSLVGHNQNFFESFFPLKSLMILDVYERLGILFFTFLVGVRIDVTVIKRAGGLALVIGIASFFLPLITTNALAAVLKSHVKMDKDFENSLPSIGFLQSMINFQATYSILTDLKLLNSELGRLVLSSSMISSLCSWCYAVIIKSVTFTKDGMTTALIRSLLSRLTLLFVVICVCRPVMFWMIKNTPEGKTLKESYVCTLTLMVLGGAFYCEITGIEPLVCAIFLGMAVPSGPPLGSGLVDKLECFVSAVLLPSFFVNLGRKVDVHNITKSTLGKVGLFIMCGILWKIIGCVVPSIYKNVPVVDAFLIGLLMSCQGFIDFQFFSHGLHLKFISEEIFSQMVIMAILHSAIVTPLVRRLYDPSRRSVVYRRRMIQHSRHNGELRILACVHQEDNVLTLTNILEASNPTRESPISVYVLELVELIGQAMPLLISHKTNKFSRSNTRSTRIVRAFQQFEMRNHGVVMVQCFTSIAPFRTIDNDICSLALDKVVSLVIIPFHKTDGQAIKVIQKKVLQKAPCSVGILVDKETTKTLKTGSGSGSGPGPGAWFTLHVCVIFLGGPDDREALAFGTRMAEHPNITVTVIHVFDNELDHVDLSERQQDLSAINDFKIVHMDNSRAVYKEEGVREGPETVELLRSLGEGFDLMLVGRRHEENSRLTCGLLEWCEVRELGVIGDMLTSSDFKNDASVLVVQQQPSEVDVVTESSVHWTSREDL
ncbi:cation/H(+) antiporter 15-like [Actinidia eriantha]|uniref:cation/H(+) antiporter 15-like n=1 Tax=Actinidia eriantha TaxID=165200 RepID=UPI00259008BF|nr:cation/H(+) antiporter 15-like [Actinidia eriantha]